MVVNLAERYTNLEGQEDDVRVNFIRDVDVKVIGYGFKLNMDITSLDNLMFPGFLLIYFLNYVQTPFNQRLNRVLYYFAAATFFSR